MIAVLRRRGVGAAAAAPRLRNRRPPPRPSARRSAASAPSASGSRRPTRARAGADLLLDRAEAVRARHASSPTPLLLVLVWAATAPMTPCATPSLSELPGRPGRGSRIRRSSSSPGAGSPCSSRPPRRHDAARLRRSCGRRPHGSLSFGALYLVHVRDLTTVRGLATAGAGAGSGTTGRDRAPHGQLAGLPDRRLGLLVPLARPGARRCCGIVALWRSGPPHRGRDPGPARSSSCWPPGSSASTRSAGRFAVFLAPALAVALAVGPARCGTPPAGAAGPRSSRVAVAADRRRAVRHARADADRQRGARRVIAAIGERIEPGDGSTSTTRTQYAYAYYGREGIGFAPRAVGRAFPVPAGPRPVLASGPGPDRRRYTTSPDLLEREHQPHRRAPDSGSSSATSAP